MENMISYQENDGDNLECEHVSQLDNGSPDWNNLAEEIFKRLTGKHEAHLLVEKTSSKSGG